MTVTCLHGPAVLTELLTLLVVKIAVDARSPRGSIEQFASLRQVSVYFEM